MYYLIKNDVEEHYLSIHKIHPLKQKQIEQLIRHTRNNFPDVEYIAVFGSVVDGRCRPTSDIDICVWGGKRSHFYTPSNDVYDVIFAEDLTKDSSLRKIIREEGYIVYAKNFNEKSISRY